MSFSDQPAFAVAAAPGHGLVGPSVDLAAPALRGAAAAGPGASSTASSPGAVAAAAAAASAAAGLALVGQSTRRGRRSVAAAKGRTVALRALGSIEQFKVFGPEGDQFEVETDKILGVGGQGTVYQCHKQSDPSTKYACKTIPIWRLLMDPNSAEKLAAIEDEVDVLSKVQGHPNIAACLGCYDAFRPGTAQAQYKMMVMELVHGGELADVVKERAGLDEDVARNVFNQTLAGLSFLHSRHVIHRDLKCENILVCGPELTKDTKVTLIDFGVAKVVDGTILKSCVGTTEIMAPELVCARQMIFPAGFVPTSHGPFTFKAPGVEPPGFGIVSQRPDGKGAMVDGVESTGQAANYSIGDGWAISKINGIEILDMPFVKDFNEIGAGTKGGVTAIAELLGSLESDFTMEFIELPKREFSYEVDMWSLGVCLYTMLAGQVPFKTEKDIIEGHYAEEPLARASPEAKDLIHKLINVNASQRPLCNEVAAHPWVTKGGNAPAVSAPPAGAAVRAAPAPPAPSPAAPPPPPAVAAPAPPAPVAPAAPPPPPPAPVAAAPPSPAPAAATPSSSGSFSIGQKVSWNGKSGVVRFIGSVKFATGEWIGVELDTEGGMHNGSVMGERYFSCAPKRGIFAQAAQLQAKSLVGA